MSSWAKPKKDSKCEIYPPINTVGQPRAITPPCAVESPIRAAGIPPIITVADPLIIESGGPTHVHISPMTAAGIFPINTVGFPGPVIGPPTWGMGEGKAGVCIGQVCISVNRAAGCPIIKCFKCLASTPLSLTFGCCSFCPPERSRRRSEIWYWAVN